MMGKMKDDGDGRRLLAARLQQRESLLFQARTMGSIEGWNVERWRGSNLRFPCSVPVSCFWFFASAARHRPFSIFQLHFHLFLLLTPKGRVLLIPIQFSANTSH